MISTKNPFPGMNPFLERHWASVHASLISFIWTEIAESLPPDLIARPEERLVVESTTPTNYRADVGVSESWRDGTAHSWQPQSGGNVVAAEPEIWHEHEVMDRWVEIRATGGTLVTAIEVLSPVNKLTAFEKYKQKQSDYRHSTASLVEIDLLRCGRTTLPIADVELGRGKPGTFYYICCSRAWLPGRLEVYRWPLCERIPAFRIPLRETDKDIVLDLQPLLDRCYETGRYFLENHDANVLAPFLPQEAAWVDEQLKNAGLRAASSAE